MVVMKFGGTSVGSAGRMRNLVPLVHNGRRNVVVLSAMSGTTNALLRIATLLHRGERNEAGVELDALELQYRNTVVELFDSDAGARTGIEIVQTYFGQLRCWSNLMFTSNEEKLVAAQGELLSTALFHEHLRERGIHSSLVPALNFMRTDEHGEPDLDVTKALLYQELKNHPSDALLVTQGYICRNAFGDVDNLKRGGSDYTATILGALLDADEIQIWTDIDGMHNNDPRYVKPTRPIAELAFDEAAELAYFGAKILHPTCVLPAQRRNIPVRLLNTMQPDKPGTVIKQTTTQQGIKAVASKDGITAVKIRSSRMLLAYGFLRAVFEVFERYKTPIDAITTSEVAVSLTVDDATHLDAIVDELQTLGTVEIDRDLALVCVVGDFGPDKQGYALKIFEALRDIPVRMISYGGSERNVTVVVKTNHKIETLAALNRHLFNFANP